MKVVINTDFGGFGLSYQAFELFLQKKGIEYDKVLAPGIFDEDDYDFYHKGRARQSEAYLNQYELCSYRADPDLVAVVEELGEQANSWAANLKIVEVPDDVEWHIAEYDGLEHVAENHRRWG